LIKKTNQLKRLINVQPERRNEEEKQQKQDLWEDPKANTKLLL